MRSVQPSIPSFDAFSNVAITSSSWNCCCFDNLCLTLTGSNFGGLSLSPFSSTVQQNIGRIFPNFRAQYQLRRDCGYDESSDFFVEPFAVYGISITACVLCIVPSAVRIEIFLVIGVIVDSDFTRSSLPLPSIVIFAPESRRPSMTWPLISTHKCGRLSFLGTVMSAANSIISRFGASSSELTVGPSVLGSMELRDLTNSAAIGRIHFRVFFVSVLQFLQSRNTTSGMPDRMQCFGHFCSHCRCKWSWLPHM